MKPLTTTADWNSHWEHVELPLRIDPRSFYYRACDRLFHAIVPGPAADDRPRRFIDVGCGVGQWLIYFHEHFGCEVVGIDTSSEACERARRNLALAHVPGEVIQGDVLDEPLAEASFDIVYSGGLVEHFDDPLPIVAKMSRLVKPGGLHIIFVPNQFSFDWKIRKLLDRRVTEMHRPLDAGALADLLTRSGLESAWTGYLGSFRLPWVRRRGVPGLGIAVSTPAWLLLRSLDRTVTGAMRRSGYHPEGKLLSQEIVAFARAGGSPSIVDGVRHDDEVQGEGRGRMIR